jgi:hypothetical protein
VGLFDPSAPLVDGRQSETAATIARGVRRMLRARGFSTVTELPLLDGRRADIVALGPDGSLLIIEIKSSVADFRADRKWRDYAAHCDRLYFAIGADLPAAIMPSDAGLIIADPYGAEIVREPEPQRLAPATRRAVMLRFAQAAADRLHRLADPNGVAET